MKKFRCPCCGKEDGLWWFRLRFSLYYYQNTLFYKYWHHARGDIDHIYYYDIQCQECGESYMALPYYPLLHRLIRIIDVLLVDIGLLAALFVIPWVTKSFQGTGICLLVFILFKIAKVIYSYHFQYFAPYNTHENYVRHVARDVVLKLEPEENWKPRHMDILMLRFKEPCEYPKFKEAYQDSLVPVCLYMDEPGRVEASFLKKEPILKKMLHQGAAFELIDQERVALGVIDTFLSEEYQDLCEEIIK